MTVINILLNIVFFNVFKIFGLEESVNLPLSIAVLLIGCIYLMFRLRFIQFTHFGTMLRYIFKKRKGEKNSASPIATLLTSIASCTGMNATAGMVFMIAVGGIGTIFWLPILAFLCMPFRFAEVYLSHSYRSNKESSVSDMIGGPFDYIKKGLSDIGFKKAGIILSFVYAALMAAAGTIGVSMYEMNQAVVVFEKGFSFLEGKRVILSTVFTILIIWVALGGTKRIEKFMSTALSVLSITYISISIVVILFNYENTISAFALIYEDAMHPKSIAGGFVGSLCMCARKCALSHETGLGTSGIVHALSAEKDSIKEATRSMFTPFVTGLIICLATSLVLISTGVYKDANVMKDGVSALTVAFGSVCKIFSWIIIIIIPMFTVNVTIGWSNYVIKCTKYLFKNKKVVSVVMIAFFVFAFLGGIIDNFFLIMNIVDLILMFILLINVPIIMMLSGIVLKAVKKYKFE